MTVSSEPTPPSASSADKGSASDALVASASDAAGGSDALVGKKVNKYEIIRVIGRGGMGTVFEAVNTAIGKRVAMKFIDAGSGHTGEAAARFQREAQAASAVESAHIVQIFDSGISEDGQPYIVMELLRGEDLGHRIKRCGRLDLPEALHVTAQILRGLHRAHKAGIVHRDLKPDNIFLVDRDDDPNFAKILDFGISKVRRDGETPVHTLTRQGTVLGTPFYMSPEQAQAQPDVDARSDLWSVGAILYECLTGRPPYTGATYEQVIVNICMHDADDVRVHNPAVPEAIADAIARALSRDREARFGEARELLDALRQAASGVISSRSGLSSEDSFSGVSSSNPGPVGGRSSSSRSTGRRAFSSRSGDDGAFDATVKFESTPPSAMRRSVADRERAEKRKHQRTFALVAVSALLTGGLGAFFVARTFARPPPEPPGHTVEAVPQPPEPPAPEVAVRAAPPEPTTAPSVTPTADHPTPPAETAEPRAKAPKPPHTAAPPVVVKPKPAETATAAPGSGVASGLKLKTD